MLDNDGLVQVRDMCVPMPSGIMCQSCQEMEGLQECLTGNNNGDILYCIH